MKIFAIVGAALLAGGCGYGVYDEDMAHRAAMAEEAELARALRGFRPAGPPRNCVPSRELAGNKSVGNGAVLFRGRNSDVVYLNRPAGGCPHIGFDRALVFHNPSANLCAGDIAHVADFRAGTQYAGCAIGEFIPYRRIR